MSEPRPAGRCCPSPSVRTRTLWPGWRPRPQIAGHENPQLGHRSHTRLQRRSRRMAAGRRSRRGRLVGRASGGGPHQGRIHRLGSGHGRRLGSHDRGLGRRRAALPQRVAAEESDQRDGRERRRAQADRSRCDARVAGHRRPAAADRGGKARNRARPHLRALRGLPPGREGHQRPGRVAPRAGKSRSGDLLVLQQLGLQRRRGHSRPRHENRSGRAVSPRHRRAGGDAGLPGEGFLLGARAAGHAACGVRLPHLGSRPGPTRRRASERRRFERTPRRSGSVDPGEHPHRLTAGGRQRLRVHVVDPSGDVEVLRPLRRAGRAALRILRRRGCGRADPVRASLEEPRHRPPWRHRLRDGGR